MKFTELGLHPKVLKAVEAAGYETPTPIQAQAIPHALEKRDVLGIAQTGTGKTASFTLPMLTLLAKGRARARMPRSLILAPTRELAAQVAENFDTYGAHMRLTKALLIGGVSFGEQDKVIDRGVDVLIATPGRLLDHFERGKLLLTGIEILVIDEADRMLDMGFIEDIERIIKLTPISRQTLFFSATMPPEITRLTQEFLNNPERVEVARQATTAETVEQRLCMVPGARRDHVEREKRNALRALIDGEGDKLTNAIVFCNRKRDVATLFKSLTSHGYNAGALHGDLEQRVRMQVLDGFRNDQLKILVASDVAARGLDIPRVSHVFNFDVPVHAEDYVHRIGRTGRAGRTGVAMTLATAAEDKALAKVEDLIKKPIPRIELPGVTDRDMDAAAEEDDGDRRERRGRSRRSDRKSSDQRGPASKAAEAAPAERSPRRENDRSDPAAERGDGRRDGRRRGGRRREERDERVVGMGDHVPAFILREVPLPSRRKARDDEDEVEATESLVTEVELEQSEPATPPSADKARPQRSKGDEAEDNAAEDNTAEDNAADAGGAEAEAESAAPRRRRSRRRDAKSDKAEASAGDAKQVDAATTAGDGAAAEEAPKRARRSRRKSASKAAAEDGASAEDGDPADPKTAAGDDGAAAVDEDVETIETLQSSAA